MWITAEVVVKEQVIGGYRMHIMYGTDDADPIHTEGSVLLGPGQDESTLKGAIIQQLADLNTKDQQKQDPKQIALDNVVQSIQLGPVDVKDVNPKV